ncbi:MAG TPA: prenyltransferase [Gemmatimonadales bacterium]|nr:prenyltransferase [Gemmatimonadales bacterium]
MQGSITEVRDTSDRRDFAAGFRRLADPKISLASMAAMTLAAAAAWHAGGLAPGWLALTVAAIFAVEVAKNASGEIYDWRSGNDQAVAPEDRSPFSGGKRVLVDGLLTQRDTWLIALAGYLVAIVAGLRIAQERAPAALPLGVLGLSLAFWYHAPPVKLAYRGLGELAVGLAYGPVLCAGTFLVQLGGVPPWVIWLSLPLGLLIALFLVANEFPDYRADRHAGKRTLVVRLGRPAAARLFAAGMVAAGLLIVALPALGAPLGALAGLVALVPGTQAARTLLVHPDEVARIVPAQARTLLAFLLYALAAGLGTALTPR